MFSPEMGSMIAVIEIEAGAAGELPIRLIRSAYVASRAGPIGLLLRGTTPDAMDTILDPLVADYGTRVHGVRYLSPEDQSVAALKAEGRVIVATSASLRVVLEERGITCVPLDDFGLLPRTARQSTETRTDR